MNIIIDSREKDPLPFRPAGLITGTERKKLDAGDYSLEGYEDMIGLERKSAADLYGTLGKGNKRFQKELRRSVGMDYFGIIIESSFTCIRDKVFEGSHYSKMRPDVVMSILFTLMHKYGVHVHFCNNRNESSSLIRKLLLSYHAHITKPSKFNLGKDMDMIKMVVNTKKRLRL